MLLSLVMYALLRRRRDYTSVTQVLADRYEITVLATSIHRAREVLEYNWPGQRIWGATAAILYNLRQRLEGHA